MSTRSATRILSHLAFALILAVFAAWTATALSVHLAGWVLATATGLLALTALASFGLHFYRRGLAWAGVGLIALVVGLWYQSIQPLQDRAWASDVAHGVTASVAGDSVTLHHVRAFDWASATEAVERWQTRSYDLDGLASVDMFTSVWDSPDIAHLLVSFGFHDGRHVVFSVEIRREQDEAFSVLGGFFRQFELVLIAADESDIVQLRTNQRGEDVRIYPVKLDAAQRRSLFLSYLDFGNDLAARPAFYNTVTANCTSSVYRLAQVLDADLPLDWRLLMSGHLPEYLEALGGLEGDMPMAARRDAARISERALTADPDLPFEIRIRRSADTKG